MRTAGAVRCFAKSEAAVPRSGVLGAATDLTPILGANGNGNSKVNRQAFHGQAFDGQAFDQGEDNEPQIEVNRQAFDEEARPVTTTTRSSYAAESAYDGR
jgi:hypothetical protein